MKKEALLYERLNGLQVRCNLCAHQCKIKDGNFGLCGVRQNEHGMLYTLVYGDLVAVCVDPIEKKPLYHFLPGTDSFSIATVGCNFRCAFCQNWEISQANIRDGTLIAGRFFSPEEIIKQAKQRNCQSISYTYTEPTIFFEYAYDCARLAKESGLRNVFVTNGYMTDKTRQLIAPYLDAANIDLKFFSDENYQRVCNARLKPVLESIEDFYRRGVWIEVTTLVVPGENDSEEELTKIAKFLSSIDKQIPWHISRFFPNYKYSEYSPTEEEKLKQAHRIGLQARLKYIYIGNVYGWGSDTFCPGCGRRVIKREGYNVLEYQLKDNNCIFCQTKVAGIWQ
ncbi:MAG: AmmeMemoRadiSam system radical SAM enzyme [Candidatus Omnitrophica bacterium]|nr:AmmeMemoRadiSam system radical SAM enzyme [Candidatus Omnitrophota bacterium]